MTRLVFDGWIAGLGTTSRYPDSRRALAGQPLRIGNGRREWYGARDLRPICSLRATLHGADLGALAPVAPPVRFGFGYVPPAPALTRLTTTAELPAPLARLARPARP